METRQLRRFARIRAVIAPDRLFAPEPDGDVVDRLIHDAEIRAEAAIAWLRLVVALLLAALITASAAIVRASAHGAVRTSIAPSTIIIAGFAATSLAALVLIRTGRYRPRFGWGFALLDVGFALAALADGAVRYGLAGNALFLIASAWLGPLVIAFNALRYRPAIIAASAALYVAGGIALALDAGISLVAPAPGPAEAHFFDLPPNAVRLALVLLAGICLTLVVVRGRRLLVRALIEQRERDMLTRFLPAAVVSELTRPGSPLRRGVSLDCVVLFVDLRDSTRIAEHMPPERIADFLTRFRRRIVRVVGEHGGLIEKFAGDGALIVFGVPEPRPDDGRRALACARELVAAIDEWNENRDPASPLSIVVGLHAGTCFCGVVGGEERLEFTVVGDPVNVAARLEGLAKRQDEVLVATRTALDRSGEDWGARPWRHLGSERLRGRDAPVEIFAADRT